LVSSSKGKPHIKGVGEENAEKMPKLIRIVKEAVMKNFLYLYNL
jgi:hypothetical protein